MPTTYSARPNGWRHELNTALKPPSENGFLDGFLQRQAKRDGFGQHKTKPLKSYATSGPNHHEQGRRLDNSNNKNSISGNDFLDGFLRRSKSETEPCATSKHNFYEQELSGNATDRYRQSPQANYTNKVSVASTQKKRNGFVEHTTKTSNSYGAASQCSVYERRCLNKSAALDYAPQCTRKPSLSSIRTPSPSTQYISTSTSSNSSSKSYAASPSYIDEQQWWKRWTDQNHLPKYVREPLTATVQTPSPSTRYISTSTSTSRSTSRVHRCPKISEAEWQELEKKSQHEQKKFLEQYVKDGKFEDVLVSFRIKNVKRGDHIFYPGASGVLYDHHLLCTEVDGDDIHTIEYTGPSFGLSAFSQSVASSNVLAFGAIKRGKLTYKQLEKKKAKIKKWPDELQRFSADVVIARALKREHEQDYQFLNNNCEHFVTWCICGLSTSLQVKPFYKLAWESARGASVAALAGVPTFLKAVGNVSDELLGAISSSLSPVGFALGGVIETGFAAWNIYQDWKRMKEGHLSES